MPELPEVETARKEVDHAIRGRKIVDVKVANDKIVFDEDSPAKIKKTLLGAKAIGTDRRGKYFWIRFQSRVSLVLHFGMTGHVSILDQDKASGNAHELTPKAKAAAKRRLKSLRLELVLDDGTHLRFIDPRRFGRIRLSEDPLKKGAVSKLGFDPLVDFPTPKTIYDILQRRKAPLKAVLLDQSVFAGVGNWIADEVLFQARLSPHRLANSLSAVETKRLCQKILAVIRFAVKANADAQKFPEHWLFHVRWGKKKDSRASSGHAIKHETIGGRTTAWVPDLQK